MFEVERHYARLIFYASIAWWGCEDSLRLLGNPPKSRPDWNLFSTFEEARIAFLATQEVKS